MPGIPVSRVVAVVADLDTGIKQIGSGYLLGAHQVLTALHCTRDIVTGRPATALRVIRASDGSSSAATVRVASALDVVILTVADDPWWAGDATFEPAKFGRVDRDQSGVLDDCEAAGFPVWQLAGLSNHRDLAELHGRIYAMEGRESQRLVMRDPTLTGVGWTRSAETPHTDRSGGQSAWSGLSGAAVFQGELLLGVIIEHHPRQGPTAVQIRPVDAIVAADDPGSVRLSEILGLKDPDVFRKARTQARTADTDRRIVPGSPYRGLRAYEAEDWELFFGRDEVIGQVLDRLSRRLGEPGLLVISGVSGAGKSSLLRAGVLPRLRRDGLAGTAGAASWPCLMLSPGAAPLDELAVQAASLAHAEAGSVQRELVANPAGFARTARQVALARREDSADPRAGRLVVIIDQFEQVFSVCPEEGQRRTFITALHAAATTAQGPDQAPAALVVLAVRADFESRCASYPELAAAIQDRYLLTAMTSRQLRLAITGPAVKVGSRVEADLTETLLDEIGVRQHAGSAGLTAAVGVLPLVSHALDQAWRHRAGDTLTLADYEGTGGIESAVARSAQKAFKALTPPQQAIAQQLFTRLTAVSPDGTETAIPLATANLASCPEGAHEDDVEAVLEAFTARRLLTRTRDTVEITHEVLLTAWPLLRDTWLAGTRADRIIRTALHARTAEWERHERDAAYLYTGSLLETADIAAAQSEAFPAQRPALTPAEQDFLGASHSAQRRRVRIRRGVWAILATLTVALAAITALVFSKNNTANSERDQAISERDRAVLDQIVAEAGQLQGTDQSLATQLNLVAHRINPTPALTDQLLSTYVTALANPLSGPGPVRSVAFSPDGRILAVGSTDSHVWLWNVADPAHPEQLGQPLIDASPVATVAFSPNGRTLAAGSDDGTIRLWNITNPAQPASIGLPLPVTGALGGVPSVAFSPDGRTLAAGSGDDKVWLWNITNPAHPEQLGQPLTGPTNIVDSVAFSPDGQTLAAGSLDGKVWLWNVTNPAHPALLGQPLTGPANIVYSVAFSPNARTLAVGSADDKVWLWNITNPAHPALLGQPLTGPASFVYSVAFSPNGQTLAAGSADDKVWLWNITNPADPAQLGQPLTGASGGVVSVAFSPDGQTLTAGDITGTVWLWNLPSTVLSGPASYVTSVAYSPDGRTLAAGSADDKVWLWNITNPAHPEQLGQPLTGPTNIVESVGFSPDGRTLAAGSLDGKVWLWNITNPAHPEQLGQPLTGANGPVYSVAFSPDGRTLAAGTGHDQVWLWNVTNPAHPALLGEPLTGPTNWVPSVAFSPDGRTLAAGSIDDKVWLWNITNPTHPEQLGQPLTGPTNFVYSVAFSPNARTLAAGSADGKVWLWNITNPAHPEQLGQPLTGPYSAVDAVAFSPDGRTLAAGAQDGMIWSWDLDLSHVINRICTITSSNLNSTKWTHYIPLPYDPPCRHN